MEKELFIEQAIGGVSFMSIDIPGNVLATHFYAPTAIYYITPVTEEMAIQIAKRYQQARAEMRRIKVK